MDLFGTSNWDLISQDTKDRDLLMSFFVDKDKAEYGAVLNNKYAIVRAVNNGKAVFYVQNRIDYVKQQSYYFYSKGYYEKKSPLDKQTA